MTNHLLFSLVELPRAVGSTLDKHIVWTAPGDLGTPAMAVNEGDLLDVDLTLTSVDDGVLVNLATQVTLRGECVRCLDPVERFHDIHVSEMYFEQDAAKRLIADDEDGTLSADDLMIISERDTIDIESLLRDSIITLVEPLPLCSPDCEGLCPGCGDKWADLPADHEHQVIDPRLAGLAALLDAGLGTDTGEEADA